MKKMRFLNTNRTLNNAMWIIGCRVIQAFLNLLITMFTARFLGPSNFGLINYAMSLVAFVTPVMQMGLTSIIVQELILNPQKEGKILGSSITSCMISAALSTVGVMSFVSVANFGETETIIVCGLYCLTLFAQALEIILYWFQAHLLSRYSSVVSLGCYLIVAAYKFYLLLFQKSVYWFAVANALDFFLISVFLLIIYKKQGGQKLGFSFDLCKQMINKGKYYILSGLMVAVFAQTDRVMLKLMVDDAATGFYSAAVTCAGMTGFVFCAIIDSARPAIFQSKKCSNESFERNMKCVYSIVIYCALLQSLFITVLAKPVVYILYGETYIPTINALRIIVWYTTFSYIGAVRNIWILAEEKQSMIWKIDTPGALANIVLNAVLIPRYGINGAAIASLLTQFFTNILMGWILPDIRRNNTLILQSLNPQILIKEVHKLIHRKTS